MSEAVTVIVVPIDTGDQACDAAALQRCLAALQSTEAADRASVTVLGPAPDAIGRNRGRPRHRDPAMDALNRLLEVRDDGWVVLLEADTEPLPGFLNALLHARLPRDGVVRVYSPRVRGVVDWPQLPERWRTTETSFPRQAVLLDVRDWPHLSKAGGASSPIGTVIDAAAEHLIAEEATVLGHRPATLAHGLATCVPGLDITRCAGTFLLAAAADLPVAIPALQTWLQLAACGIREAVEPLAEWRAGRSRLGARGQAELPRLIKTCDQHAGGIIHESLLEPAAADESRQAVLRADLRMAEHALHRHPDAYCAAVAVMTLAPDEARSDRGLSTPRVLVQGWFDSDLPADARAIVDEWTRLHPHWRHLVFDSESADRWLADALGHEAASVFRSANPVAKSNLFRYAYLAAEGGVWSDVDDRPLRCLDPLVDGRGIVVIRESIGAIGDNFIAVAPHHPVLIAARDEAFRNESEGYAELQWLANGPGLFTRKVAAWIAGLPPTGGRGHHGLDYLLVPNSQMVSWVSAHEELAYKSTSLAWDADEHRRPEAWTAASDRLVPTPLSARQRSLMSGAVPS